MSLPVNFIIYGRVRRENGIPINGVRVTANDVTIPQGIAKADADINGRYLLNIKNYASNGDAIEVSCSFQRESRIQSFTLDVGDGTKEINLDLLLTQAVTKGHGEGPAVYVECQQCGYNNYYPKPCESYCCHACQVIMNDKGESGGCNKKC